MRLPFRPLDRYVFGEFWKIFVTTAFGFPLLVIVIDLTDHLEKYLGRNLSKGAIALSYVYWIPDSMFMVLPAAVLFATVFSIGAFTRHSEITAAKATGISFHRLVAPIFAASVLAAACALLLGEIVPFTNAKRAALLEEHKFSNGSTRFNFAYSSDGGRVYKISTLAIDAKELTGLQIERKGRGPDYPSRLTNAQRATWDSGRGWLVHKGVMHILPDSSSDIAIVFDSLRERRFIESPADLLAKPRSPQEMGYRDLSRFISALERSGGDANELKVERALKLAIPITCIIIAIFGAPLATSTQRGGAAYGIGVSLATTVLFLMLIQITKAIGGGGILPPTLSAWLPNILFGVIGFFFLLRTRT
ncbi:MAG: LptF/LptG family permease [Gemmatimonadota bacterium]|nr:LptF/LptG family permease [Gemmatimonadota bacterium]